MNIYERKKGCGYLARRGIWSFWERRNHAQAVFGKKEIGKMTNDKMVKQ